MAPGCTCNETTPFCDVCFAQQLNWIGGVAGSRGWYWADRRARTVNPRGVPWLDFETPATRAHAISLVADLGRGDERLRDELATRCWREAGRRWQMLGGAASAKAG